MIKLGHINKKQSHVFQDDLNIRSWYVYGLWVIYPLCSNHDHHGGRDHLRCLADDNIGNPKDLRAPLLQMLRGANAGHQLVARNMALTSARHGEIYVLHFQTASLSF